MFFLNLSAVSGMIFNDLLATLSMVGTLLLFLGSFSSNNISARLVSLGEWSTAPLVFGSLFQVALYITGLAFETESIGFVIPMSTGMVNGLFAVSILLLIAHWWLKKKKFASIPR